MQIKDEIYRSIAGVAGTALLALLGWAIALFRGKVGRQEFVAAMDRIENSLKKFEDGHYSRLVLDDKFKLQDERINDIRADIQRLEDNLADSINCLPDEIVGRIEKIINRRSEKHDSTRSRD